MTAVTLGGLSRYFLSKQRAYNAVVCDRSSCSHTTLLQRFVLGARVCKKPYCPKQRDKQGSDLNYSVV